MTLPTPELNPDLYEDWMAKGRNLHAADPSDASLQEWKEWSKASPKYDADRCDLVWAAMSDDLDDPSVDPSLIWYNKYKGQSYAKLAARMIELQRLAKAAQDQSTRLGAEFDVIRLRVVPERFLADETTSMNIAGIGRLGIARDAYCTQPKETQEELFEFLRENGFPDLIKEGVNPSSLKSLVKDLEKEASEGAVEFVPGESDLDEESLFDKITKLVKYTPFMRASVTKK